MFEAMLTTAPPPCIRMWAISYFIDSQIPVRFVSSAWCHCSSVMSATAAGGGKTPTLLTAMSSPPKRRTVPATSALTSAALVTSAVRAAASPPSASMSATVSFRVRSVRPATATRAPWRAKARATARPIPVPPPVTSTARPSKILDSPVMTGPSHMVSWLERSFPKRPARALSKGSKQGCGPRVRKWCAAGPGRYDPAPGRLSPAG